MHIICTIRCMGSLRRLQRGRGRLPKAAPPAPAQQPTHRSAARPEITFHGRLIPVSVAARRLKVHPTTLRRRGVRGEVTLRRNAIGLGMTEEDLDEARRRPPPRGRPQGTAEADQEVIDRALAMRGEGLGYAEVARRLNAGGVPTARNGRQWWASSVRSLCIAAQSRRG